MYRDSTAGIESNDPSTDDHPTSSISRTVSSQRQQTKGLGVIRRYFICRFHENDCLIGKMDIKKHSGKPDQFHLIGSKMLQLIAGLFMRLQKRGSRLRETPQLHQDFTDLDIDTMMVRVEFAKNLPFDE